MRRCAWPLLVIPICIGANAQSVAYDIPGRLTPEAWLQSLGADLESAFYAVLDSYESGLADRPFDIGLRVDRCRFIDSFSYTYEYVSWIDSVYELSASCSSSLEEDYPDHPEVILFGLENLYGQSLLDAAAPYLDFRAPTLWTRGQNARFFDLLAKAADAIGDSRAGPFAIRALQLDDAADVRLVAAQSLLEQGDTSGAQTILRSPFDAERELEQSWYATQKLNLLASMGDRQGVMELYEALRASSLYYDNGEVARALRDVGAIDLARSEYAAATEYVGYYPDLQRQRFELELSHGTGSQALAAYSAMRDRGWALDPIGVNRVALLFKDPSLPWRARDLLAIAGLLGASLLIALIAALPVSLVHYRGLARRARHGLTVVSVGWRLRHAWYALFAFGMTSILALYGRSPVQIDLDSSSTWYIDASPEKLAWTTLMASIFSLILLAPLARASVRGQGRWTTSTWSVRKCLLVAAGTVLVLQSPLIISWLVNPDAYSSIASDLVIWEVVAGERERFGLFTALWLLAGVAPVAEEFVFRGVVLQVFSKHVSFTLANVAQATIFASVHADAVTMPWVFVMGIVAGFMAKRSGGLLAPIVMHSGFNLVAGLIVLT